MFSLWGTTAGNIVMTFIVSMVPVIELRGAIPLGVLNGLDVGTAMIVSIIGNLVPVPFIIIFIRKIFKFNRLKDVWMAGKYYVSPFCKHEISPSNKLFIRN